MLGAWQWGTVPEWLAAIGTVGTLLYFAASYINDRRLAREEWRQSQARLFDAWLESVSIEGDERHYTVRLSNASGQAIRNVDIGVELGGQRIATAEWGTVPPTAPGDRNDAIVTEALGPSSLWLNASEDIVRDGTTVLTSFVDASGNRWHRTGKGELRFLYNLNDPPLNV